MIVALQVGAEVVLTAALPEVGDVGVRRPQGHRGGAVTSLGPARSYRRRLLTRTTTPQKLTVAP